MFPFLFLVFGVGVLAAYGFSSQVRERVDDYVRALQVAHESHRAADAGLRDAHRSIAASVPEAATNVASAAAAVTRGIDAVLAAAIANQRAAQSTATAAQNAKSSSEREAVAASASRVLERGKKIEEALAHLGVGQCGVRAYAGVSSQVKDTILKKLHAEGMAVTGDNPWDIDTQLAGVKLRAVWDPGSRELKLVVVASSPLAPCSVIWGRIEPILRAMIGSPS